MSILTSIKTINIGNAVTKTIGVGSLGLVAYDSHTEGKHEAHVYSKHKKAESMAERYIDDLRLDSPSVVKMKAKEGIFHYSVDENLTGFFTSIAGYAKGFGSMIVSNAIPFALSVGTLLTKGITSKLCGAGLAVYGGIFLLQEGFGIGKPH